MIKNIREFFTNNFKEEFIDKFKKFILFWIVYSILFIGITSTLQYTFLFVLAGIIALTVLPFKKKVVKAIEHLASRSTNPKNKKRINSIVSILITVVLIIIVSMLASGIILKVVTETTNIILYLTDTNNINIFFDKLDGYVAMINNSAKAIDINIIETVKDLALKSSITVSQTVIQKSLSIASSIPFLLIVTILTIMIIFFSIRDIDKLGETIKSSLTNRSRNYLENFISESRKLLKKYVRAYIIIMFITFIEVFIVFTVLDIKYSFTLAVITAIVDFLPAIGLGLVYLMIGIISLVQGNATVAIGIAIAYVLAIIIRQILEQKIVASSLDIHPIVVIGSLIILLSPLGVKWALYFLFLVVTFKVINNTSIAEVDNNI